jgi:hypothetical protein
VSAERDDLVTVARALAIMLRREYGCGPLAEVIRIHGVSDPLADEELTQADVDVVARFEYLLAPLSPPVQAGGEPE